MRWMQALLLPLMLAPLPVFAAPLAPEEVMVHVEKAAGDGVHYSHGSGIYLGAGLVLTANHVIRYDRVHPQVRVLFPEQLIVSGEVVMEGQDFDPELDVALVRLDIGQLTSIRRDEAPTPVCSVNPGIDIPVSIAAGGKLSSAMTYPAAQEYPAGDFHPTQGWTNVLTRSYPQGSSGGGVFDPVRNCLEGILILQMGNSAQHIELSAFVPASRLLGFLDAYFRRHPEQGR